MIRSIAYTLLLLLLSEFTASFVAFPLHSPSTSTSLSLSGKGFGKPKKPPTPTKEYPPWTESQLEQWMAHIPVYAVTDIQGNGQAIQVKDKTVFYFFLSSVMAEAYGKHLNKDTIDAEWTVSGLFLGKIWHPFNLLNQDNDQDVEYRLVPDPRDLMTAQTLLEMQSMQSKKQSSPQLQPYNSIPLFGVRNQDGSKQSTQNKQIQEMLNQMVSSHYLFFSSRNMLDVLDQWRKDEENEGSNNANANQWQEDDLVFLHDILEQTKNGCTTDYSNRVLVPPTPIPDGTVPDSVLAEQLDNHKSFLSQRFLLPLFYE